MSRPYLYLFDSCVLKRSFHDAVKNAASEYPQLPMRNHLNKSRNKVSL